MATALAGPPERDGLPRTLLRLALAGLAVRVVALLLEPSVAPVADERMWVGWARIIADKQFDPLRHALIFHPPVYPYFLALACAGLGLEAAKWLQVLLAALMIPAVGAVAARAFSARVGVVAAAVTAFYPELVWFSFHFWVESIFMVLLWWGFERLLAADLDGRPRTAAVAGLVWGLAILTRETALYFLPVAALWLARPAWRAPRAPAHAAGAAARGALFVLAAVAVVSPWTYRNHVKFGGWVAVSTAGGQNLFQGNTDIPRDVTYQMVDAVNGRLEQYRYARHMGLEAIRDRQPTWFFEKLYEQMPLFWEAESMAVIHVKRGAYGPVRPPVAIAVAALMITPYLLLLAAFVPGLAAIPLSRAPLLLAGFLLYYNLIHVVTHGFNRYRLPVMPVVFCFAAHFFVGRREGWLRLGGRRLLAAAVLGLVCLASVAPSLRAQWRHEAFGRPPSVAPPDAGPPGE